MKKKDIKKIDELTNEIGQLERQQQEIEKQIIQKRSELYNYKRQVNRGLKLTDAMVYVLRSIASGATFRSPEYRYPYRYILTHLESGMTEVIKGAVFDGLRLREALAEDEEKRSVCQRTYKLTDHGRSLVQDCQA